MYMLHRIAVISIFLFFAPLIVYGETTSLWLGESHKTTNVSHEQVYDNDEYERIFDFVNMPLFSVGDINGDGYKDTLAWSNFAGGLNEKGLLYFGPYVVQDNNNHQPAEMIIFDWYDDWHGPENIVPIGDINGDGYDDIIFEFDSMWWEDDSISNNGYIPYIFFGRESVPPTVGFDDLTSITYVVESDKYWYLLQDCPCDVNGDSVNDLVVTTNVFAEVGQDDVLIFFGGDHMTSGGELTADLVLKNIYYYENMHAADWNGDGITDLYYEGSYVDENLIDEFIVIDVVYGSATHVGEVEWTTIATENVISFQCPYIGVDCFVSSISDVNGDTYSDVIFQYHNFVDTKLSSIQIFFGGPTVEEQTNDDVDVQITTNARFGRIDYTSIADINADGMNDLIISTPHARPNDYSGAGALFVFYGTTEWQSSMSVSDADLAIYGHINDAQIGSRLHTIPIQGKQRPGLLIDSKKTTYGYGLFPTDVDNDGFSAFEGDCHLTKRAVFPSTEEEMTPDGIDNNCNGVIDEGYTFSYKNSGPAVRAKGRVNYVHVTYEDGTYQMVLLTPNRTVDFYRAAVLPGGRLLTTVSRINARTHRIRIHNAYTGETIARARLKGNKSNKVLVGAVDAGTDNIVDVVYLTNTKRKLRIHLYGWDKEVEALVAQQQVSVDIPIYAAYRMKEVLVNGTMMEVVDRYGEAFASFTVANHSVVDAKLVDPTDEDEGEEDSDIE